MILWIVSLLSYYICLTTPEFIVLDLSKDVDHKNIILEKKIIDETTTYKYIPREKFRVFKIIDDKCVIWDGWSNDGKCTLAIAHLFNNSSLYLHIRVSHSKKAQEDLYFQKKDGYWLHINQSSIPSKHHFNQLSYNINKRVKFDINSYPDDRLYKFEKFIEGGITKGSISPKLGVDVRRVVERNTTIWVAENNTYLFQIIISYIGYTPCLMELILDNNQESQRKYFERKNLGWTSISFNSYKAKLSKNDFYLPLFDIKNLDLNKFTLKEYEVMGIKTSVYTPMLGITVQHVVEGKLPIWECKMGDYVDKLWIYSRDGQIITTHLSIVDLNNRKTINNYRKYNDGWRLVEKGEL